MKCTIKWDTYTRTDWENLLKKCRHVTLLQAYYYAQAMREVHQQNVRHGLIQIDGVDAGVVQMQEVSLFRRLIHMISIDRGPLWFDGFGKIEHLNAFADAMNTQFPPRFGRKRRFIPEFFAKNSNIMLKNWKKDRKNDGYSSFLIDISKNSDEIRKNLKKKWRNSLVKGEKGNLTVKIDYNLADLGVLLKKYAVDRMERLYNGASPKFIAALAKYSARTNDCLIMSATEDGEVIASILIFIHGSGATYQIGWTTPYGRNKCAHQVLLWNAIIELKKCGVTLFDLGGYNDEIEGIHQFKKGMGGQDVALIGSYS